MHAKTARRTRAPLNAAGTARMWNSMRQLRTFTSSDIEATAEVKRSLATAYITALTKAEYVQVVQPYQRGVPANTLAVYRLARNTGPLAPRVSADGIYDGNLADPVRAPRHRRINAHANELLKSLREIVDLIRFDGAVCGTDAVAIQAAQLLDRIDGVRE